MKPVALSAFILAALCATALLAQRGSWRWGGSRDYYLNEDSSGRTAREFDSRGETPNWTNVFGMERDVFTFARIRYHKDPYGPRRAGNCMTDIPDSDLNFSYRLQQMTSIRVDPDGRILNLTDPDLFEFPFIYIVEPGAMRLDERERQALRKYLLNGGFLMADDFWGPREWANFEHELKQVLPENNFVELPMDHPIFHSVFDLGNDKNALQTPNFMTGERSQYTGVTWEDHDGVECREVHIRALFDENGRMMVIACHNTDNGDGWEREGEFEYFFHQFAEKRAYPLGINIVFYAMTH